MDAGSPSATPTFASRTPLHIGAVGLGVRDLDHVLAFYRDVIGLAVLERTSKTVLLGAGDVALLELEHRPTASPDDPRTAGLYHTAVLMPTRADLARWMLRTANERTPITGMSDHLVSEAIYLDDPEGNGVEVYSDRPAETWHRNGNLIEITTDPLDVGELLRAADGQPDYDGAPAGLRIGHVHLRVGNVDVAEAFYRDALGLVVTRRRGGASFLSSGGYHHHIATNVWHSAGAGPREESRAGLSWFSFEVLDHAMIDVLGARLSAAGMPMTQDANGLAAQDPWAMRVRFVLQR
jgi:catechol 2,3-dioxygenase